MAQSTRPRAGDKPDKPRFDFPLFAHGNGRWAKKVKGKLCYFGAWADDPEGERALKLWAAQKDDLLAGVPQVQVTRRGKGGVTVKRLVNEWLNAKRRLLEAGEITARTFGEYHAAGVTIAAAFGAERSVTSLTASDFGRLREQLAKRCGPVRLGNEITRIKMAFRFGFDEGLIDQPMRYGQSFNKPAAKVLRQSRADNGSRMFEADEIRAMLAAAKHPMQAMILMAVNCGFGQSDIANLPLSALDLKGGWATFPRPKTGIPRRAKLWSETVAAVREAIASRPEPESPDDADLAFLTRRGRRWVRPTDHPDAAKWTNRSDMLGKEFAALLKPLDINGRRGFYALRHTFQTVAEECRDLPAVMHVMGHSDASMSARYRERITDERLQAVAATVHAWLFGTEGGAA